jgi:hypothetical protein
MQVRQIQDLSKAQEIKIAPIGDLKFLKISGKFWEESSFTVSGLVQTIKPEKNIKDS